MKPKGWIRCFSFFQLPKNGLYFSTQEAKDGRWTERREQIQKSGWLWFELHQENTKVKKGEWKKGGQSREAGFPGVLRPSAPHARRNDTSRVRTVTVRPEYFPLPRRGSSPIPRIINLDHIFSEFYTSPLDRSTSLDASGKAALQRPQIIITINFRLQRSFFI